MKIKTKQLKVDFICACDKNKSLSKTFEVIVDTPSEEAVFQCPTQGCVKMIKISVENQLFRDTPLLRID